MTNDAKLGLVIGVGLVIAVAIVFFQKEMADGPSERPAVAAATSEGRPTSVVRPTPAATTGRTVGDSQDQR
jgi:hypothetical protein